MSGYATGEKSPEKVVAFVQKTQPQKLLSVLHPQETVLAHR